MKTILTILSFCFLLSIHAQVEKNEFKRNEVGVFSEVQVRNTTVVGVTYEYYYLPKLSSDLRLSTDFVGYSELVLGTKYQFLTVNNRTFKTGIELGLTFEESPIDENNLVVAIPLLSSIELSESVNLEAGALIAQFGVNNWQSSYTSFRIRLELYYSF